MPGQTTLLKRQSQISGGCNGQETNVADSIQEVPRRLLTPDECMRIPGPVKVKDRLHGRQAVDLWPPGAVFPGGGPEELETPTK
jgi:hypothetical protein